MGIFRNEIDVAELTHTSTQGWLRRDDLSARIGRGWHIAGVSATGPQHLLVLLRRRRWFWQKEGK